METRRIKARNGEGLTFSVVGLGTGPMGDFYELLDEKTEIATVEQGLASVVGYALPLRRANRPLIENPG